MNFTLFNSILNARTAEIFLFGTRNKLTLGKLRKECIGIIHKHNMFKYCRATILKSELDFQKKILSNHITERTRLYQIAVFIKNIIMAIKCNVEHSKHPKV